MKPGLPKKDQPADGRVDTSFEAPGSFNVTQTELWPHDCSLMIIKAYFPIQLFFTRSAARVHQRLLTEPHQQQSSSSILSNLRRSRRLWISQFVWSGMSDWREWVFVTQQEGAQRRIQQVNTDVQTLQLQLTCHLLTTSPSWEHLNTLGFLQNICWSCLKLFDLSSGRVRWQFTHNLIETQRSHEQLLATEKPPWDLPQVVTPRPAWTWAIYGPWVTANSFFNITEGNIGHCNFRPSWNSWKILRVMAILK